MKEILWDQVIQYVTLFFQMNICLIIFAQYHTCPDHISLLETRERINLEGFQHYTQLVSNYCTLVLRIFSLQYWSPLDKRGNGGVGDINKCLFPVECKLHENRDFVFLVYFSFFFFF